MEEKLYKEWIEKVDNPYTRPILFRPEKKEHFFSAMKILNEHKSDYWPIIKEKMSKYYDVFYNGISEESTWAWVRRRFDETFIPGLKNEMQVEIRLNNSDMIGYKYSKTSEYELMGIDIVGINSGKLKKIYVSVKTMDFLHNERAFKKLIEKLKKCFPGNNNVFVVFKNENENWGKIYRVNTNEWKEFNK